MGWSAFICTLQVVMLLWSSSSLLVDAASVVDWNNTETQEFNYVVM